VDGYLRMNLMQINRSKVTTLDIGQTRMPDSNISANLSSYAE
jgi:hypothetical protein